MCLANTANAISVNIVWHCLSVNKSNKEPDRAAYITLTSVSIQELVLKQVVFFFLHQIQHHKQM